MPTLGRHSEEAQKNRAAWEAKPLLQRIYADFYAEMACHLLCGDLGITVELGSGIGVIRDFIPECVRTDVVESPWIDQVENAYALSFDDGTVANLILLDVFHHLQYPGTALWEFGRALTPGGRLIIFEPCISLLGRVVFGLLHPEPIGRGRAMEWYAPQDWKPADAAYYAAQGNASRIFLRRTLPRELNEWQLVARRRLSAISYIGSGGYSRRQVYPDRLFGIMKHVDRLCDRFPGLFATRLLVVLQRRGSA